jgi:AraC-like DNA-binding protein
MDPLTQIIRLLRPQGAYWQVVEAHNNWTIRYQPANVVVFGQILTGAAIVQREDGIEVHVEAGDFLLMVDPPKWQMRAGTGEMALDYKTVVAEPSRLLSTDPNAVVTKFVSGNFSFAAANSELLQALMLPLTLIKSGDVASARLGALLTALGDEVLDDRPARGFVVEHLLELILVEALRYRGLGLKVSSPGLIAGLMDPKLGKALRLMHDDAKRPWTVARLAREVGLSRSAFATRFAQTVGVPPIDYISRWRLALARDALAESDLSMTEIAEMVGFQSVSAFSTFIKRETGSSPSAYRRASSQYPTPSGSASCRSS